MTHLHWQPVRNTEYATVAPLRLAVWPDDDGIGAWWRVEAMDGASLASDVAGTLAPDRETAKAAALARAREIIGAAACTLGLPRMTGLDERPAPIHCACGEHFLDTCPTCPKRAIPMLSLDELAALARAATPGPWSVARYNVVTLQPYEGHNNVVAHGCDQPDARYIAAVYPEVVLALILRVQALAAERDQLAEAAQSRITEEMAKTEAFIEETQARIAKARRRASID